MKNPPGAWLLSWIPVVVFTDMALPGRRLRSQAAVRSTITQIYEGTNQIQRMVMARQLLK